MKLVTQTIAAVEKLGSESAGLKMLCEAGYDGLDYSMFGMKNDDSVLNQPGYEKHALRVKELVNSYGLTFEQAHAPFASARDGDEAYNRDMLEKLKRSIEIAGIIDAKIIVVHPVFYRKNKFEKNMELYGALQQSAKDAGVKIAVENMWGRGKFPHKGKIVPNVCSVADEFNKYVDALDPEYFTACLDLGHCGLVGENAPDMIRAMGNRIGCFHIHDNDNIHDSHTLPYTMDMNWEEILRAIAEIDYKGNFTYEADSFLDKMPTEFLPEAAKFMVSLGRFMISRIDEYKAGTK